MRLRERLLVFLGVCLPVPVLAATGLSVPLPGTVERMAAELVPFADTVTLADAPRPAHGSIVLTEAERQGVPALRGEAPPTASSGRQAPPQHAEQGRAIVAERQRGAIPATEEADGRPPAQPKPAPSPPPAPTVPAEHAPAPGAEKPKPPSPEHEPKPKPKPTKPKPKPKESKEPKEPKEPKPPEPRPAPEKPVEEEGAPPEEDIGSHGEKPEKTAPPSSSAHGR